MVRDVQMGTWFCFMLAGTLLLMSACEPRRRVLVKEPGPDSPVVDLIAVADGLAQYIDSNGVVPSSKEALREFCTESGLPCRDVDWSRFSWREPSETEVVVEYSLDDYSVSITVQTGQGPSGESDSIEDDLKCRLRRLMDQGTTGTTRDGP